MRVHVTDLKPGDCLKDDTFSSRGIHVLPRGTKLQPLEISLLVRHGVDYVDIDPETPPPQLARTAALEEVSAGFDSMIDGFESIYLEALASGKFNRSVVDDALQPMLATLDQHKDVVTLLLMLERDDDYTYNHSLQVGMLSYYIAKWLGYTEQESYAISRAGYLIDIGKCKIDPFLLNKPGKLSPEEFDEMKLHTQFGYEIIRSSMSDLPTALAALQHHEREDGSGYPTGMKQIDIHPFSQIAAVADVYSAMTTARVYQSKKELIGVLRELHSMSFGKLNGRAVQALIHHLLPSFIGKRVLLSSGDMGVIIMNNPIDAFRPLIRLDRGGFLDLSAQRDCSIVEIYME